MSNGIGPERENEKEKKMSRWIETESESGIERVSSTPEEIEWRKTHPRPTNYIEALEEKEAFEAWLKAKTESNISATTQGDEDTTYYVIETDVVLWHGFAASSEEALDFLEEAAGDLDRDDPCLIIRELELVVSDGQYSIGSLGGIPVQWPGNGLSEGAEIEMDRARGGAEFSDGNTMYRVTGVDYGAVPREAGDARWEEVEWEIEA